MGDYITALHEQQIAALRRDRTELAARIAQLENMVRRVRALCDNADVHYGPLTATLSTVDVRTALDAVPAAKTSSDGEA